MEPFTNIRELVLLVHTRRMTTWSSSPTRPNFTKLLLFQKSSFVTVSLPKGEHFLGAKMTKILLRLSCFEAKEGVVLEQSFIFIKILDLFLTGILLQNCKFMIRNGILHTFKHLSTLLNNFRQQKWTFPSSKSFWGHFLKQVWRFLLKIKSEKWFFSPTCHQYYWATIDLKFAILN